MDTVSGVIRIRQQLKREEVGEVSFIAQVADTNADSPRIQTATGERKKAHPLTGSQLDSSYIGLIKTCDNLYQAKCSVDFRNILELTINFGTKKSSEYKTKDHAFRI